MVGPLRPERSEPGPRQGARSRNLVRRDAWTSRGECRTGTATRRTGVRVALVAIMQSITRTARACGFKHARTCGFNASTNTSEGHELLAGMAYSAIYGVRHSPLSSIIYSWYDFTQMINVLCTNLRSQCFPKLFDSLFQLWYSSRFYVSSLNTVSWTPTRSQLD